MVLISRHLKAVALLRTFSWVLTSVIAVASTSVKADVLFEGYYQIESDKKPIGYTVQRYSFDKKTKTFSSVYFVKTRIGESTITESLQAKATEKFEPISYQYTAQVNDQVKTIDASFKGYQMVAQVSDGTNKQTLTKTFPKGTFLSTFLGYLMLQNGYKANKKFSYKAIAEEEAEAFAGEAWIKDEKKVQDIQVFRILNKFKGAKFISFVTPQGEILRTNSPLQKISTELVSGPARATQGQMLSTQPLTILFGEVPKGKANILAKKSKSSKSTAAQVAPSQPATKKIIEPIKPQSKPQPKGQ